MDSEDSVAYVENGGGKYRLIMKQLKLFQWSCTLENTTVASVVPNHQQEEEILVITGKLQVLRIIL
jgi:hypothetical protein